MVWRREAVILPAGTLISVAVGVGVRYSCRYPWRRSDDAESEGKTVFHAATVLGDLSGYASTCECEYNIFLDDIFVDIVAHCVARYLMPEEMAKVRLCQRCFDLFAPVRMLRQLKVLGLENKVGSRGLTAILRDDCRGDCREVTLAAVHDSVACGGNLQAAASQVDAQGRSALLIAVQRGWHDAVQTLLSIGSQVDLGDTASGWSPLMFAISKGDWRSAELLFRHGASINFQARPHGWTPLVVAVAGSELHFVEWLLDRGADAEFTMKNLKICFSPGQLDVLVRIVQQRRHEGKVSW
eukprot:TRINITY_DN27437_c0_g1_i1.p1 TRINITY_DN27437_c0_g1~~TRINITY_DN27437_c0_g1_i1.p1  ORF type:complete len:297 (-),score=45.52 TRINITY_DN27437_c0_g1_i1:155-1045(-)